jgi:hypothetical protein
MFDPTRIWNTWFSLSLQAARLAWDAQSVVALRLMRISSESALSRRSETHRMVTEKMAALTEAQTAAAIAAVRGGSGHRVAKKVLGVYKKRVRRNKKRLARKF